MDIKQYMASKKFQKIVLGILCVGIAVFIFQLGVRVGYHRSAFSAHLGDRYMHEFDGGQPRGLIGGGQRELPGGHGTVGKIMKVSGQTFVVATPDNLEAIVRVDDRTLIRRFRDNASTTDLILGDHVVVVGVPNQEGEVVAKLIRIVPAQ